MKPIHVAFLFFGPELDPKVHRSEIKTNQLTLTSIGISVNNWEQAIAVAKDSVAKGAQIIELCSAFGPIGIAKISKALNYKIPVGGVLFGPEAFQPILDLLKD